MGVVVACCALLWGAVGVAETENNFIRLETS